MIHTLKIFLFFAIIISSSNITYSQNLNEPKDDYFIEYTVTKQYILTSKISKNNIVSIIKKNINDTSYAFLIYNDKDTSLKKFSFENLISYYFPEKFYDVYDHHTVDSNSIKDFKINIYYEPYKVMNKILDTAKFLLKNKVISQDSVSMFYSWKELDTTNEDSESHMKLISYNVSLSWLKKNPYLIHYNNTLVTNLGVQMSDLAINKVDTINSVVNSWKNKFRLMEVKALREFRQRNLDSIRNYKFVADSVIGKQFPEFDFTDLQNEHCILKNIKADVIVIDFWYVGCMPCNLCLPHLSKLHKKYREKNVTFIGMDPFDFSDNNKSLKNLIKKHNIEYQTLNCDKPFPKKLNINAYPTLFILDKDYKIIKVESGYSPDFESRIENAILEVLKKK